MKVYEGKLVSEKIRVGIIAARFNEFITSKLLSGALDTLKRHNVEEEDIHVAWVPGAFEIPLIASKMAESGKYDAVICLGAVIRGATSHYDYVCNEVSKGIAQVSLSYRHSCNVRRRYYREHRTGHRTCRHKGRKQRVPTVGKCHRNGQPHP